MTLTVPDLHQYILRFAFIKGETETPDGEPNPYNPHRRSRCNAGSSTGCWDPPDPDHLSYTVRMAPVATPFRVCLLVTGLALLTAGATVLAHPMDGTNAGFVQSVDGPAPGPFLYLGAKHMVTGYDHLLFLVGVIFFLYRLKDVLLYVSLFTLGHSLTLLVGVLGDVSVNAYAIDAIIGLSVVYKGFENVDGFERVFHVKPNAKIAVLVFGLFHGLGLATKLQDFMVSDNGVVANILSFNAGVEIGQFLALAAVLALLGYWRTRPSFLAYSFATNTVLMVGGFLLAGFQIVGFVLFS